MKIKIKDYLNWYEVSDIFHHDSRLGLACFEVNAEEHLWIMMCQFKKTKDNQKSQKKKKKESVQNKIHVTVIVIL